MSFGENQKTTQTTQNLLLSLGNLPHTSYVTAALEYLDDYPFDRRFITPTGWAVDPNAANHQGWEEKARFYLKASTEAASHL